MKKKSLLSLLILFLAAFSTFAQSTASPKSAQDKKTLTPEQKNAQKMEQESKLEAMTPEERAQYLAEQRRVQLQRKAEQEAKNAIVLDEKAEDQKKEQKEAQKAEEQKIKAEKEARKIAEIKAQKKEEKVEAKETLGADQ